MMMVMRVLLLLGWFCVGLSSGVEMYGETLRIRLHRKAQTLEFSPKFQSGVKIVWKREGDDSWDAWAAWNRPVGEFVIQSLTQEDSGVYKMKDKHQITLYTRTIDVAANTESYERSPGESISIDFNLDRQNCHIFFYSVPPTETAKTEIVRYGSLRDNADCAGFKMYYPCGIENQNLKMSCNGRFEVKDGNDNTALIVSLRMKASLIDTSMSKVGIGFGIFCGIFFCCACVKCCCGGSDSSSEKEEAETPDAEPITSQQSDNQPVRPRSAQPSPRLPAQRPRTPTGPQMHSRPRKPPAYSKIKNEGSGHETDGNKTNEGVPVFQKVNLTPKTTLDAPTIPILMESDHDEPRFELKGVTFPSVLSSDSTCADVYNSDKLNFL